MTPALSNSVDSQALNYSRIDISFIDCFDSLTDGFKYSISSSLINYR